MGEGGDTGRYGTIEDGSVDSISMQLRQPVDNQWTMLSDKPSQRRVQNIHHLKTTKYDICLCFPTLNLLFGMVLVN